MGDHKNNVESTNCFVIMQTAFWSKYTNTILQWQEIIERHVQKIDAMAQTRTIYDYIRKHFYDDIGRYKVSCQYLRVILTS